MAATSSGGKASRRRKPVTSIAQTKNGSLIQVMPLHRRFIIVVMKFTAPKSEEVINNTIPNSQNVCPVYQRLGSSSCAVVAIGEYIVHPASAAPEGIKKLANMTIPPSK